MRPLIFLADDDALVRALVELRLGVDGYSVVSVDDGDQVAQRLTSISPALIILDLQMPRMSGLAVLEILAKDPRLDQTPIMMLTASGDAADVKAAATLGVTAYMLKPFEPDVLANRVRRILSSPKGRRPAAVRHAVSEAETTPPSAPTGLDSLELDI